ncbi:MAG: hypothetical protein KF739_11975 [Cryobacterium sp.]|nr:hypothetical protein [Micrococcales bacterium]MBX3311134.1 hypothetical protein [Cryobacterium sp.]MCB1279968.1 hypothetical protein [Salinibacterium sp.]
MKRIAYLVAVFTAVLTLVLPFVGGSGPSLYGTPASAVAAQQTLLPIFATAPQAPAAPSNAAVQTFNTSEAVLAARATTRAAQLKVDFEHLAQKPVPVPVVVVPGASSSGGGAARRAAVEAAGGTCPSAIGGSPGGAPGRVSSGGVQGTTSGDLASFAATYNAIRVANCLQPIAPSHIRYDSCMETRLFWMAEDPSTDPSSAWGHMGSQRSDGVPSQGCDGNLAGGYGNTGSTVATKWWNSSAHRASLYRPTYSGSVGGVCIYFAMTHGGIPNEPYSFTRAAAVWGGC